MYKNIDEKIIPMKLDSYGNISMSLEGGYYISGKLETFENVSYFNHRVSLYTPVSFIDMPDEIKEIKYPTSFRPEVIKTNLAGDVNFNFCLLEGDPEADAETLMNDFKNLLAKAHGNIRFGESVTLNKEENMELYCFDFVLPGIDEKIYHRVGMGKADKNILQGIFNCRESQAGAWEKAVTDVFQNIRLIRK